MSESYTHGCGTLGAGSAEFVASGADMTQERTDALTYGAYSAPRTPQEQTASAAKVLVPELR